MMADRQKIAVVTGAANGLGRAIALRLAADGARIAAIDKDAAGLASLAAQLGDQGTAAYTRVGDMTDTDFIVAAFAEITHGFGEADILVNNVGGSQRGKAALFATADLAMFDQMIDLNLRSTVWATRQVVAGMQQRGWGRIVNITSEAAFRGTARFWDYGAAKAGVVGFTRSLAIEVAPSGVTVNAVGPGLTRTAAYDQLNADYRQRTATTIPTGAPGEPEDIAHVVSFFASEGSRYVTGQTLLVNGATWML
jgi:acetoacetyl-CoA reductase/3-oxoacyl-[acyl-carrier protein] reductase